MKYLNILKYKINNKLIEVKLDLNTQQIVFLNNGKILPISNTYYRDPFVVYSFDPYMKKRKPELLETRKDKKNIKKEMKKHKTINLDRITPLNYKEYFKNGASAVISNFLAFISMHSASLLSNSKNFMLQGDRFYYIVEDNLPHTIFYKQDLPDVDTDKLYNEMISVIKANENIDEEAKEILINEDINHDYYKKLINDYGKYMDFKNIKRRLATVKVKYNNKYEHNDKVAGHYNNLLNEVKMFCMMEEEDYDSDDKAVLLHEFNHVTSTQDLLCGSSLKEAITEQLKIKYFNEGYHTYYTLRFCSALLEHLVGEDALLRYYYQANMPYLIDKLREIYGNSWDATKLISLIDTINFSEQNLDQAIPDVVNGEDTIYAQNYEQYFQTRQSAIAEFLNLYGKYYYAAFAKDMNEDILVKYYQNMLLKTKYPCRSNFILPGFEDAAPFIQVENISSKYNDSHKIFPQDFKIEITLNLAGDRWECHIPLNYEYNADTKTYNLDPNEYFFRLAERYWTQYLYETEEVNIKGR